jgi:hypothetical protein
VARHCLASLLFTRLAHLPSSLSTFMSMSVTVLAQFDIYARSPLSRFELVCAMVKSVASSGSRLGVIKDKKSHCGYCKLSRESPNPMQTGRSASHSTLQFYGDRACCNPCRSLTKCCGSPPLLKSLSGNRLLLDRKRILAT